MLLVSPREWVGKGVDDHSRMGGGCTNCKRPPKKNLEIYCSSKPPFCNRMRAKSQKPISCFEQEDIILLVHLLLQARTTSFMKVILER